MMTFWHGFALGVVVTVAVCGYFYIGIKARHEAHVSRLEAKSKPSSPDFVQDRVQIRGGRL